MIDLVDIASGTPYAPEAYLFVQKGLRYTVHHIHGDAEKAQAEGLSMHVSGRDLCLGMRDLAIQMYGLLARRVLEHWNIHRTDDFGRIVFTMIDAGLMHRQDEDRLDDFFGIYTFDEAFARDRVLALISEPQRRGSRALDLELEELEMMVDSP